MLVKGMDWLEQQFHTDTDHLALGFHATDMVLHSVTDNRELMSIHCGGGHRSYGFTPLPKVLQSKEAMVVYIKKSVVCIKVADLTSQLTAPVLQRGFVGREAVCLQIVHSDPVTGGAVVAVGSEDCSVCLLNLQPSSDGHSLDISRTRFIHGHISTVRALSTSPSRRENHTLLFSGGARASLKTWNITGGESETGEVEGPEVVLEAELSIHEGPGSNSGGSKKRRRRRKGPGAESLLPECRIMALASLPLSEVGVGGDNKSLEAQEPASRPGTSLVVRVRLGKWRDQKWS
jgi:hypothetical protein